MKDALPKTGKQDDNLVVGRDIHDILTGEYTSEEQLVFKIETLYPISKVDDKIPEIIKNYAKISGVSLAETLFIDTETTGLSGGTGTYTFLVGCGYVVGNNFKLIQFFLKDPAGEEILVNNLLALFEDFSCMLTFNGKSFDIPLLKTRFTLHSFEGKLDHYQQIDLLHLARRFWRNRLDSCNLQNLEDKILLINRDPTKEIPGGEIPWVYFDYLDTREATFLSNVISHNQSDIYNMFLLYQRIVDLLDTNDFTETQCAPDWLEVARLWEEFSNQDIAIKRMKMLLELDSYRVNTRARLSNIYKGKKRYDEAIVLWHEAADNNELYAFEELAKYYEHQKKDYKKALSFAEKALNLIELELPFETEKITAIQHRIGRLKGKVLGT